MTAENSEIGLFVNVGGVNTNYHDLGEGPTTLLLHGSGPGVSAWANWRLVFERLSSSYRLLAPDIVGFGFTEQPTEPVWSMPGWLDHVVEFIEYLDIAPVRVIGNSFGGALSLWLAKTRPDLVDRMVLMGTSGVHFELTPELDRAWGYTPSPDSMRSLLQSFAYDESIISDELVDSRYQASIRSGSREAYEGMFPAPRQRWIDAQALSPHELSLIDIPTLAVHGIHDRIVPLQAGIDVARALPDCDFHAFGRCGHWTQIERVDDFCRLVSSFFESSR